MAPPRRVALPGGPLRGRLLTLGRVATRSDSWSVLAFGAKWIISGRQAVRCGRPACITNAYSWHNLQLVHRLGDYHGTPIINLDHRASTNILMHRLDDTWARAYYSTPYMGTDGRWNGANSPIDPWRHGNEGGAERGDWREMRQLDPRGGPLHRETACPGGTQGGPNCLTHSPPPVLSDAES